MLRIDSEKVYILSQRYGDAFYVLDSDVFLNNYMNLTKAYKSAYPNFNIAYSYKTNYIPKLCKIVNDCGGYAEVVSWMEAEMATKCGVETENIIWNGPIKSRKQMRELLISGGIINIDNASEWDEIKKIARENPDRRLSVGIRCNFDVGDGIFSRFGVDVDGRDFIQICSESKDISNIDIMGIHCHFASRNPKYWKQRTLRMLDIYERMKRYYGIEIKRIDLGGGIYGPMPEELAKQIGNKNEDFQSYALKSAYVIAEHFHDVKNKPELVIEPGTALVANAMRAVFKVESIKTIRGKTIAAVYGSQKNINMLGVNPPMEVLSESKGSPVYKDVDFVGYTCIESDYIYKGYNGTLSVGDFIVIGNCGSYSIVMKPPFILPNFPVIDISMGVENAEVIMREETVGDLYCKYQVK